MSKANSSHRNIFKPQIDHDKLGYFSIAKVCGIKLEPKRSKTSMAATKSLAYLKKRNAYFERELAK